MKSRSKHRITVLETMMARVVSFKRLYFRKTEEITGATLVDRKLETFVFGIEAREAIVSAEASDIIFFSRKI